MLYLCINIGWLEAKKNWWWYIWWKRLCFVWLCCYLACICWVVSVCVCVRDKLRFRRFSLILCCSCSIAQQLLQQSKQATVGGRRATEIGRFDWNTQQRWRWLWTVMWLNQTKQDPVFYRCRSTDDTLISSWWPTLVNDYNCNCKFGNDVS